MYHTSTPLRIARELDYHPRRSSDDRIDTEAYVIYRRVEKILDFYIDNAISPTKIQICDRLHTSPLRMSISLSPRHYLQHQDSDTLSNYLTALPLPKPAQTTNC